MKKYLVFILCLGLLFSCTKETVVIVQESENSNGDSQQNDLEDRDGDSVKNIIEEVDGTNPDGPCSYNSNRFDYSKTSQAWRDHACDEDGVSNGKELDPDGDGTPGNNQTDPRNGCDFDQAEQDFSGTTSLWRDWDCDQDGVTNGVEVDPDGNNQDDGNGTDPLDQCSLIISDQNVPPSNYWLTFDCDGDCRKNYEEIEEGTDPFDGSDFLGAGDHLSEVRTILSNGEINARFLFEENGSKYGQVLNAAGDVFADFIYDSSDRLIFVETVYNGNNIEVSFDYTNDLISQVTYTSGSTTITKDVQYNGNEIRTFDGNEPAGLFFEKFVLDPVSSKLSVKEKYYQLSNGQWRYDYSDYSYDNTMENLLRIDRTIQGYDPVTGEFSQLFEGGWDSYRFAYSDATAQNPGQAAAQHIYLNYVLQPEIYGLHWMYSGHHAATSKRYFTDFDFYNDFFDSHFGLAVVCKQVNLLPNKSHFYSLNGDFEIDLLYE